MITGRKIKANRCSSKTGEGGLVGGRGDYISLN
jgi:hypothetical protein